jgi:hypothetical protein
VVTRREGIGAGRGYRGDGGAAIVLRRSNVSPVAASGFGDQRASISPAVGCIFHGCFLR